MAQTQKLTAEALLSVPRRSPGIPNYNGRLALYTVSTHIFGDKSVKEVRVMDLEKQTSVQISDDEKVHDALWIPGTSDVAYLKSGVKGKTELRVTHGVDVVRDSQVVATFDAPVTSLKLRRLEHGGIVVMVAGLVGQDGTLFNDEATEPKSTARVFNNANIRTWDALFKPQRYTLWYNIMEQQGDEWKLAGQLLNLIQDATLEAPVGMYGPGSPGSNFDISENGVVFAAQDVTTNRPEELGFSKPYFVAIDSFTLAPARGPQIISLPSGIGIGNVGCTRFSPDGSNIALIHCEAAVTSGNRIYMTRVNSLKAYDIVCQIGQSFDDDSFDPPAAFEFAGDSNTVIFQSEKRGRTILSLLKLQNGESPGKLFGSGSVSSFYPLVDGEWDKLLVCSSSFVDSSIWQIVNVLDGTVLKTVCCAMDESAPLGMSPDMVTEFDFKGADDYPIHSFIIRPSDFCENEAYPWVLMVHGGPVSAWADTWSFRWSAAAWAQQGYVVVCPNITGSTGYGLEHARRIRGDWCGRPYEDLLCLITSLEGIPYLDQSKAIVAGGSYGGLMISWMMGQDIINKFCGVIWQSGIYNMSTFILHMDGYWYDSPFGGAMYPWQDPAAFEKFNPSKPELVRNWGNAPPTLIIHSEKDYRCCITEGLAAFKTLQAHGVSSRFLTFSDECHWISKTENLKVWYQTVWDWMRMCVDGELKRNKAQQ